MEKLNLVRKKVYDPLQRLLHGTIGLSIIFLILTGFLSSFFEKGANEDALWTVHIFFGYLLTVSLSARTIWGFIGPKHARFSSMIFIKYWISTIKNRKATNDISFGHNKMASAAYLVFYILCFLSVLSGLVIAGIEHNQGPLAKYLFDLVWMKNLFKEPHELIAYLIAVYCFVHIAAIIWHEKKDKFPIAQSMFSGYQYRLNENKENHHEEK